MKKILLIYAFIIGTLGSLYSQQITGKVLDKENGEPLIGVTIKVEGTQTGTITDLDGVFSIPAKEGDVLLFTYVGMDSEKVAVQKQKTVEVYMASDRNVLDEFVVVGYGVMRRKDITGSIASLKAEDIEKTTSSNVLQSMAGKMPGVQVVQNSGTPGGDVTVRVRGIGTTNNADPLYVVDGIPISGGIWYLNPNDIQSIDVLKDASATAIYGARGANGVIMVTTKSGVRGEGRVSVDYSYGFQEVINKYEMLNASQYASLHNDMRTNGGASLNPEFADPASLGKGTNWLDQILRTAPIQKASALISGGDKTAYSVSLGYYQQDGIIRETDYERFTLQTNIQSEVKPWFKITSNIALSAEDKNMHDAYTLVANSMRMLPHISVRKDDGFFAGPTGFAEWNGNAINPVAILSVQKNNAKLYRGLANVTGEFKITDYLQYKMVGGAEVGFEQSNSFHPKYKWGNSEQKETSQTGASAYETLMLWDNTLTFNKTIDKHRLTVLAGTSFQTYKKRWLNGTGVGRASDQATELDNALEAKSVGGNMGEWTIMSYLGRANYSFDDKYFVTASLRADGSSRFGAIKRYGYFPSFSTAWTVSNEDFMKDVKFINFLKLRAGYGLTGNQNIDNYIYADRLEVVGQYNFGSSRGFGSTPVGLIYPDLLSNPAVRWESTEQYNIGFDVTFLNNRISLSADYYLKNTHDMLIKKPVPQTSGYSLDPADWPNVNVGKIRNIGMEYNLTTTNIETSDFRWNSSFNISFNKNKVKKTEGREILKGISLIREGESVFSFYGFEVDHIYQTLDDVFTGPAMPNRADSKAQHDPTKNTSPGDIAFKKFTEGDILADADRTIIGNPLPDYIAGLSNTFSYKGFDLSFFIQGVFGHDIWNGVRIEHEGMSTTYNQLKSTLGRWTGEGSSYSMPRAVYADPNGNTRASDRWVEDGSYIRLKNLNLGYTLPQKWMTSLHIKSAKIYANVDNLFTITDYSGLDPEVGVNGLDYGIYPTARTYMFGININF